MTIAAALRQTKLSQAAAAAIAIDEGWNVSTPTEVNTSDFVRIKKIELLMQKRQSGDYVKALATSTEECLENVTLDLKLQARLITGPAEHMFLIYEDQESGRVYGCLRVISQLPVSPEKYREIWEAKHGVPSSNNSYMDSSRDTRD